MVAAKKVFRNRGMDITTSRVKYRTSMFIKTVFKGAFGFPQYTVDYVVDTVLSCSCFDHGLKFRGVNFRKLILT